MTGRSPACQLDLGAPEFVVDPYPFFARARSTNPIGWHEPTQMWLILDHAMCSQVLRSRSFGRLWKDRRPAERFEPFNVLHRNQMMENEPPDHTRLRRKVSTAFARGHVERMRPRVRDLGSELLDRAGDSFDVLADYAEPLPVLVIAELLGAPPSDHPLLREWSQAIVRMYEPSIAAEVEQAALDASRKFGDYMRKLIAVRREDPGDDLLSHLLDAQHGADGLSDDEVMASAILLLNAGHEASVNVFGNGLVALLRRPEQWARVVRREVPVPLAVEEMLRFDSALQMFERTATQDVVIGEVRVPAGDKVAVLLGAANRDPRVYDRPDDMDVARDPNPHLAFGAGVHFCLGAPLARVELAESLGLLVQRHPDLTLAAEPLRKPTFVLRGYDAVPVTGKEGRRHG